MHQHHQPAAPVRKQLLLPAAGFLFAFLSLALPAFELQTGAETAVARLGDQISGWILAGILWLLMVLQAWYYLKKNTWKPIPMLLAGLYSTAFAVLQLFTIASIPAQRPSGPAAVTSAGSGLFLLLMAGLLLLASGFWWRKLSGNLSDK